MRTVTAPARVRFCGLFSQPRSTFFFLHQSLRAEKIFLIMWIVRTQNQLFFLQPPVYRRFRGPAVQPPVEPAVLPAVPRYRRLERRCMGACWSLAAHPRHRSHRSYRCRKRQRLAAATAILARTIMKMKSRSVSVGEPPRVVWHFRVPLLRQGYPAAAARAKVFSEAS